VSDPPKDLALPNFPVTIEVPEMDVLLNPFDVESAADVPDVSSNSQAALTLEIVTVPTVEALHDGVSLPKVLSDVV